MLANDAPERLSGLQRAGTGVFAALGADQLDQVVALAGDAMRAAGEDVAILRGEYLDAAALFAP